MSSAPRTDTNPTDDEELSIKAKELEVRRLEAEKALAAAKSPWWRRADPLLLAILAGILTLLGNAGVSLLNNRGSMTQERKKADDDLALERAKARYNLVLQAMATNDPEVAKRNIHFFIDAGLLEDADCRIRDAISQDQPVLPSLSGIAPAASDTVHWAPEIAKVYNFPPGFDGRGQTIGILEFGGSVVATDLDHYFKSLTLPVPDIKTVSVDGAKPKSDTADTQVMLDVEIIGALAPRAQIRVYFAPFTTAGFVDALRLAANDGVSVLSVGWGKTEAYWKDDEIKAVDNALRTAAEQRRITVVAATGDRGVTDGMSDHRPHVDFPGSSAWVLSVGGTSLKSEQGRINSETVWRSHEFDFATGGGFSDIFPRPDWQAAAVSAPNPADRKPGRGVPDVVATADPALGIPIYVHGAIVAIGGTSGAAPVWASLVALINQALGYNVGYFNPTIYKEIGPAGVLNAVIEGDNTVGGVKGYSAGSGWSPVAGWGSPDGTKLLAWLREHPQANGPRVTAPCRVDTQTHQSK